MASRTQRRGREASVGSIFRNARRLQGLSQSQVADRTRGRPGQISRGMVSLIERGRHLPGLEATVALTRALHLEPMEIFERVDLAGIELEDLPHRDLEALRDRAVKLSWSGDHRRALALCDAMLRIVEDDVGDALERAREEARIEIHRASALRHCGALGAARAAAERVVTLAESHPDLQARGYILLASLFERRGLRPLARDMASRAIELAEDQEPRLQGMAWMQMGSALAAWNRFEQARRAYLKAAGFIRRAGDRQHEIHIEGNLGACLTGMGCHPQARKRYIRAVELSQRYRVPASEGFWLVEVGRCAFEERRYEDAERYARRAAIIGQRHKVPLTVFRAECLRYRVGELNGNERNERTIARLRRLHAGVKDHAGVEEVEWFRKAILESHGGGP